ncbi:hypothetical protein PybrP1_000596 [[Pythium] brassicae (nom. inval.)]|nr:hypothetical protein PybrP1_000596 [[Pythium] brassicae (nom. inval.)]
MSHSPLSRTQAFPHLMSAALQHIEEATVTTGVRVLFQTLEENDGVLVFGVEMVLEVSSVLAAKDLLSRVHAAVH